MACELDLIWTAGIASTHCWKIAGSRGKSESADHADGRRSEEKEIIYAGEVNDESKDKSGDEPNLSKWMRQYRRR